MISSLKSCLLVLLVLAGLSARAQHTISGQVQDAQTHRPLGFASVFLTNTTFGTTTDSTGRFTLPNVPAGQYEFVVSYLGYRLYKQPLALRQATVLAPELTPATEQLADVVVRPKNKSSDYQRFTHQFLGTSSFSQQCRIINPQDVVVQYSEKQQELTAIAPRSLQVDNAALGYRITYHKFDFRINYRLERVTLVAEPVFTELPASSPAQQRHWEENRRKAYQGSLTHFLKSVRLNRLAQEGFLVQRLNTSPTAAQVAQAAAGTDSIVAQQPTPATVTLLYVRPLTVRQIRRASADSSRVWLDFRNELRVTYQGEYPDPIFAQQTVRNQPQSVPSNAKGNLTSGMWTMKTAARVKSQVSDLRRLLPEAEILPAGNLANPLSVLVEGYWGFEKIGEALPTDYEPTPVK